MTKLKEAPAAACRLSGGPMKLAASKDAAGKNRPITMRARSADPIEHYYWGRIVHDMAGMRLAKEVIPIDYEHYQPIGFLNTFTASNEGLDVAGELTPRQETGDRGREVIELSDAGVPYEASIYFGEEGLKIEYVGEGAVAPVNGYSFEGPGVIVREWILRGVAVCPYGYDMQTESAFSRNNQQTFTLTEVKPMPTKAPAAKAQELTAETVVAEVIAPAAVEVTTPAAAPAAEPAPVADAAAGARAEAKRFRDRFGDQGAVWFADGLSFDEAAARETKELRAQVAELTTKLSAGKPSGETDPITFDAGDKGAKKFGGMASKVRFAGSAPAAK